VIFPSTRSPADRADLFFSTGNKCWVPVGFLFADPENPGIVISEAFYTTEFMLVNRKFKLAFAPIKLMLLSTSSGRKGQRNGLFNKD
jgi:hypothetical protein